MSKTLRRIVAVLLCITLVGGSVCETVYAKGIKEKNSKAQDVLEESEEESLEEESQDEASDKGDLESQGEDNKDSKESLEEVSEKNDENQDDKKSEKKIKESEESDTKQGDAPESEKEPEKNSDDNGDDDKESNDDKPEAGFEYRVTVEGYEIYVSAGEGILPEGTEVKVEIIDEINGEQPEACVREKLDDNMLVRAVVTFDISFWLKGEEIEPEEGTVAIEIGIANEIEKALDGSDNIDAVNELENSQPEIKIFHIDDSKRNIEPEEVEVEIISGEDTEVKDSEEAVTFSSEEFSPYVVVVAQPFEYGGGVQRAGQDNELNIKAEMVRAGAVPTDTATAYHEDITTTADLYPLLKLQSPHNNCWAHSLAFLAEANNIKNKGISNKTLIDAVNYSENQLAYFMYNNEEAFNLDTRTAGDYMTLDRSRFSTEAAKKNPYWDQGGNLSRAGEIIVSGIGFASESNYEYCEYDPVTEGCKGGCVYGKHKSGAVVTDFVPSDAFNDEVRVKGLYKTMATSSNKDAVKYLIKTYGAVSCSFFYDSQYYNKSTNSFYCDRPVYGNHQVSIVGWDDSKTTNGGTGAWLLRNSWYDEKSERLKVTPADIDDIDGYFWMSYNDQSLQQDYVYALEVEDATSYDYCNQYDGCAVGTSVNMNSRSFTTANVFTVMGKDSDYEEIKAVGFWTGETEEDYEIKIYKLSSEGTVSDPTSGTLMGTAVSGTTDFAGFYKVNVGPIKLQKGSRYAVVVTLTSVDPSEYASIDMEVNYDTPLDDVVGKAKISKGQSYIYDGAGWADIADPSNSQSAYFITNKIGNIRIKTYSDQAGGGGATSHTITYNLNGGTNNEYNPAVYYENGSNTQIYSPTRSGYYFDGWYENASCTGAKTIAIAAGRTTDVTLYANWELIDYRITYELDGGVNSGDNPAEYNVESADIVLKAPQKNGYDFVGWYRDSACTSKIEKINSGSFGEITVYAKWKKSAPDPTPIPTRTPSGSSSSSSGGSSSGGGASGGGSASRGSSSRGSSSANSGSSYGGIFYDYSGLLTPVNYYEALLYYSAFGGGIADIFNTNLFLGSSYSPVELSPIYSGYWYNPYGNIDLYNYNSYANYDLYKNIYSYPLLQNYAGSSYSSSSWWTDNAIASAVDMSQYDVVPSDYQVATNGYYPDVNQIDMSQYYPDVNQIDMSQYYQEADQVDISQYYSNAEQYDVSEYYGDSNQSGFGATINGWFDEIQNQINQLTNQISEMTRELTEMINSAKWWN